MLEIEMLSRMSFLQMFGVAVSSAFNFTLFSRNYFTPCSLYAKSLESAGKEHRGLMETLQLAA